MYVLALAPTKPLLSLPPFTWAIFHVNGNSGENACCHLSLCNVHLGLLWGEHKSFSHMQTSSSLIKGALRSDLTTHMYICKSLLTQPENTYIILSYLCQADLSRTTFRTQSPAFTHPTNNSLNEPLFYPSQTHTLMITFTLAEVQSSEAGWAVLLLMSHMLYFLHWSQIDMQTFCSPQAWWHLSVKVNSLDSTPLL